MSDRDFNDGGDVLGSSEYFTGGCGCGVEGGSPWEDGGFVDGFKELVGWKAIVKGVGSSGWNRVTYLSMGLIKACIVVLIVLLFLGFENDHWSMILLYVVAGLSAVGYIASEIMHHKSKPDPDAPATLAAPTESLSSV